MIVVKNQKIKIIPPFTNRNNFISSFSFFLSTTPKFLLFSPFLQSTFESNQTLWHTQYTEMEMAKTFVVQIIPKISPTCLSNPPERNAIGVDHVSTDRQRVMVTTITTIR